MVTYRVSERVGAVIEADSPREAMDRFKDLGGDIGLWARVVYDDETGNVVLKEGDVSSLYPELEGESN
jgi:hypothetical protein